MSSTEDIIQALSELLTSVDELLQTETAQAAPELAQQLGAESQFNQAIGLLMQLLQGLRTGLEALREPLLHIGALAGLLGLLQPFQEGMVGLVQSAGDLGTMLGLPGVGENDSAFQTVAQIVDGGTKVLEIGQATLEIVPSVAEMDEVIRGLEEISGTLEALKVPA